MKSNNTCKWIHYVDSNVYYTTCGKLKTLEEGNDTTITECTCGKKIERIMSDLRDPWEESMG
jgi:hypothetical protein